ncbi:MAG: hypothetical protein ACK5AZ_24875 [Bryobacteraceae bacterium]
MPISALPALITAGGSVASGALTSRGGKTTSTTSRALSPEQQHIERLFSGALEHRMTNPHEGIEPIRTSAIERINRRFRGADDVIAGKLASRGYASSGKMGGNMANLELSRLGMLSDLEGQIAQLMLDREDNTMNLAARFLGPSGMESVHTGPRNVLGGGIGGGVETLMTLMTLDKIMKGGGGGPLSVSDGGLGGISPSMLGAKF